MRPILIAAAALAGVLALPAAAMARPGFVTASLALRAGPSVEFPAVDRIPAGAEVDIHGCIAGYAWCDVAFDGDRGWVNGDYLQFLYHGRRVLIVDYGPEIDFPIVGFDVGTYWGHYYRHRNFYGRRGYWENHYQALRGGHERIGERGRNEHGMTTGRGSGEQFGPGHENNRAMRGRIEHGPGHYGTVGQGGRERFGHERGARSAGAPHMMRGGHGPETTGAAPRGAAGIGAGGRAGGGAHIQGGGSVGGGPAGGAAAGGGGGAIGGGGRGNER